MSTLRREVVNERIKELAKQAFIYSCEFAHGPDYSPHNPYNELIEKERYDTKFAELIVTECAGQLIKWKDEPFPYDPEFGARLIKQHFRVEQ